MKLRKKKSEPTTISNGSEGVMDIPMIEIYGQMSWHDTGALRINVAGAKALIASLQKFIELQDECTTEVYASDGEGYDLLLVPGELHDMNEIGAHHYLDCYSGWRPLCGDNLRKKSA